MAIFDFKVDVMSYFEKSNYLDTETIECYLADIIDKSVMCGTLMGATKEDIAAKRAEVKSQIPSGVYSSSP